MDNEKADKGLEITDLEEIYEDQEESLGLNLDKLRKQARRIVDRQHKSEIASAGRETRARNNMALYEGKQYSGDSLRGESPWVVKMSVPYAAVAIDTRVSSLIANDYRGELFPISIKDEEDIIGLNTLIGQEFDRANLNRKINNAIATSAVVGEGYLHVRWTTKDVKRKFGDGRKGYLDIYEIENTTSVLIDPEATSLKDGRWVIVKKLISKHEIKALYPEFYKDWIVAAEAANRQEVGEIYQRDITNPNIGKVDMADLTTHYEKTEKGKINQHIVINSYLVESKVLDLRDFPIIQMRWKKEAASPYGISLMDDIGDLQRAINAIETAITNVSVTYAVPSYALRKGSGVNPTIFARSIGVPGAVISVNGDIKEAIQPLPFPKLDQSILASKDDFMAAIDRISGVTNPFLGTVGTAGNTAEGTHSTIERAKIIEKIVLSNIEQFVEDLTEVIIQFVTVMYSGVKLEQMVKGEQNEMVSQEIELSEDVVKKGYNFYINLSARTSYAKDRDLEKLDLMWQQQNQYDDAYKIITQKDLIMAHDMEDKEIYANRFEQMKKLASDETAQLVNDIVIQATELGVDPGLINKAISELIMMKKETPALDQLSMAMQELQAQQMQMKEEGIQEVMDFSQELDIDPEILEGALAGAEGEMTGEGGGMMM